MYLTVNLRKLDIHVSDNILKGVIVILPRQVAVWIMHMGSVFIGDIQRIFNLQPSSWLLCVSFLYYSWCFLLTYSMHSWTSALWNSGAIDAVTLESQHSLEDASCCHGNLVNSTPPPCPHKTFLLLQVALFCYYNTQCENSNWKRKSNWSGWDASR